MIPVRRLAMAGALSLACCAVQQSPAVTVRYEAESTGVVKDKNDAVGYDSINGIVGRAVDPPASNNELLYTLGTDRTIKVVFAGTGINFVAPITHDGSAFTWQLDEGAQSGSSTTLGICCTSQVPIPIISGLPSGLHTLEIEKANLTDFVLRMDAFDVIDNVERTRFEQDSPQVTLSADQWVLHDTGGDAAAEASGGSVAYTGFEGATATLDFVGTGVAAIVVARGDGQLFDFSIDNGLRTGSIDLRAANQLGAGNLHRWPLLLANDLPAGAHSVTLTSRFHPGSGGVAILDAFDVYNPVPEPASLAAAAAALAIGGCVTRRRR